MPVHASIEDLPILHSLNYAISGDPTRPVALPVARRAIRKAPRSTTVRAIIALPVTGTIDYRRRTSEGPGGCSGERASQVPTGGEPGARGDRVQVILGGRRRLAATGRHRSTWDGLGAPAQSLRFSPG